MKIRQASKLLLRSRRRMPESWYQLLLSEGGRDILEPHYRNHRARKADTTISRWLKNYKK